MTRINVGILPAELPSKLLLAEHREIKRIPNNVRLGKVNFKDIPSKFTLGTGHVKFFYNKLGYLKDRYEKIYDECIARGFNIQSYHESFEGIPLKLMGEYIETFSDRELLIDRITSKGFTIGK